MILKYAIIFRYGAGSEYGRELKEEARRKRLGINKRNYKPDDQPWLLSVGGKGAKKKYVVNMTMYLGIISRLKVTAVCIDSN